MARPRVHNQAGVYPNMEDHPFKDMEHGEIIAHSDLMADEIKKFIRK